MSQHLTVRVVGFQQVGDYSLLVRFDDNASQVIDFFPVLAGELFAPLRNKNLFSQVRLDSECHTLVWPNGADCDPATLREWPKFAAILEEQARSWEVAGA